MSGTVDNRTLLVGNLAYQTGQYDCSWPPINYSVLDTVAFPAASAIAAKAVVQSEESAEQHTAFLAGHAQFDGMFVN